MQNYIMALDQGTTSSRCILFDRQGNICSMAQMEFTQIFPKPGWVEHDPMEIWSSQIAVAAKAMGKIGVTEKNIAAIGITNQRETTIVWEKATGKPVYNAIVWQCRRTAEQIDELKEKGIWFVCADMDGEVMYRQNLTGPIGLVIGNEGNGVSRLVKEKCDFTTAIPMKGDIDSLNASVAAGVLAFEIVRQRLSK